MKTELERPQTATAVVPAIAPPEAYEKRTGLKCSAERTAIISVHGMGQQVPFETIAGCVELINGGSQGSKVRHVRIGEETLPQAQVFVGNEAIDIYEIYWAPVTEGRIAIHEVLYSLISASWRGIRYSIKQRFSRRLHSGAAEWKISPLNAIALLGIGGVVLLLALYYIGFFGLWAGILSTYLFGFGPEGWVIETVVRGMAMPAGGMIAAGLLMLLAALIRIKNSPPFLQLLGVIAVISLVGGALGCWAYNLAHIAGPILRSGALFVAHPVPLHNQSGFAISSGYKAGQVKVEVGSLEIADRLEISKAAEASGNSFC